MLLKLGIKYLVWAPSWCRRHRLHHNRTPPHKPIVFIVFLGLLFPIILHQLCLLHQVGALICWATWLICRYYFLPQAKGIWGLFPRPNVTEGGQSTLSDLLKIPNWSKPIRFPMKLCHIISDIAENWHFWDNKNCFRNSHWQQNNTSLPGVFFFSFILFFFAMLKYTWKRDKICFI